MADLLPCPFCGGPDVTWHGPTCTKSTPYDASHRAFPIVRCGCGVQVWGSDWDQSGASAIAKWNDRPTPKTALDSFIDDVEAADIRDAARYRWLRDRPLDWSVQHEHNGWSTCYGRNELDAQIDAAMKGDQP